MLINKCGHSTIELTIPSDIYLLPLSFAQVTAVFAADAVARLSGVVGVAAVTAGPGKGASSFTIIVN